ncbi:NADPH-dependent ferric siderophore reductase, contains FAD-binding and SIP domains [Pseudonocardia thermophila]|uniref:NADPH-dependent ferric siderophore reductase, contains FAD-binding and SIP domains n=1 Tax=Pseudonocardia thermophila TaxID=1848 RepID=A0A1M6RKS4_PSETH|nr:siderophore-interacting protein [Pseudonocardia thermophila]SHK33030.1 NADPH-dependent ferric siderophore reductase, contains FAD-binding and SIP domains [Pseudonocardia thermophila]
MTAAAPTIIRYELVPRLLRVAAVRRLTPRMVRVTLAGEELAGFQAPAPADHVKLFFPEDRDGLPVMPKLGPNGLERDPNAQPTFRDYTVRNHRPEQNEIDIDFVLHGHGPGSTWAAGAQVGNAVGVLGPRGSVLAPTGLDWCVVAGDEAALPAVARWLEQAEPGTTVFAFAEVADEAERQEIQSAADVRLTWLYRNGAEPGTTTLLQDAVLGLEFPAGDGFVWVGGEATTLKPIRRGLRERGLPRASIDVDGYWKRGVVAFDHHQQDDD